MIRGQKRALDKQPSVNVKLNASIHNRFDIEVVDAKTGEVKQKAQAENVVCDKLWTYLFSTTASNRKYFNYIHYGTGQGTPSRSDTSLFAFFGSLSASDETYSIDRENGVLSVQKIGTILESVAVGELITEVGIAHGTSSSTLCTHAMLQDMNGNQISILKTDVDIIKIYATIFVHYRSEGYDNGSIQFFPNTQRDLWFWAGANHFCPLLAGAVSNPPDYAYIVFGAKNFATFSTRLSNALSWSYDLTNKKMVATMSRMAASSNASPWVRSDYNPAQTFYLDCTKVCIGDDGDTPEIVCEITNESSWFSESVINGEAIGTGDGATLDFRTKFGYVTECEVLVDGVPATGVSVDYNQPIGKASQAGDCVIAIKSDGTPMLCTNSIFDLAQGNYWYVENVDYLTRKVLAIWGEDINVSASNDLVSWENTGMRFPENGVYYKINVPEAYQQYRYFRVQNENYRELLCGPFVTDGMDENIHFTTPPHDGAVITANYRSKTIAKDENHVFDFSIEFTIGEYTPDA